MVKRIFKLIFVFSAIACLLFACVPSVAFADVVEFQEAAKLGATIVDLYGSVNNTSLAYDALSDGSALTVIENLYQNYSSSASDPYTLAAIGAAAAAAGAIAVVYDAISGKGYVQLYQEQYVSSLDGFWDYTLSDVGLQRNLDGLFEWSFNQNDEAIPLVVATIPGSFVGQPVPSVSSNLSLADKYAAGFSAFHSASNDYRVVATSVSPVYFFMYYSENQSTIYPCYCSPVYRASFVCVSYKASNNSYSDFSSGNITYPGSSADIVYSSPRGLDPSEITGAPVFLSLADGLAAVDSLVSGNPDPGLTSTSVMAYPEYYVGDPLTAQPTITIPDPSSPQYLPSPSRINTDIEWLPEWGNPLPDGVVDPVPGVPYPVTDPAILNDVVPEIWQSVVQGVQTDPGTDPDPDPDPDPGPSPSEVFTPLLPVTLPSFNFSFSGIWHYVREWVASLGAWFTTLFSIWSALPYAMVVPVYATAVVVIVLGVYKRFFM